MRRWLFSSAARRRRQARALLARLHRDEGGNIIVLYVAAAMLLVGMLWAIIGTGARMVQKETIQSSADAAAFSAAVIKAKGLNIIAFCNLLMALLLAIIMLLRLIKGALLVVLGVCVAACFDIFGGEALCAMAPTVESLYNEYSNLESQLEPRIMDAMRGLAKVERAVNKTFPALALVEAYRVGTNKQYQANFGKGQLVTVAWPLPVGSDLSLPTKDGTWDELCSQATASIDRLIEIALSKMGLGVVSGIFGGAVKMLLTPLQGLLCGGDSSAAASATVDTYQYPPPSTCGECAGADKSTWQGTQVIRNPDGSFKSFIPGQTCQMDGFSSFLCNNPSYKGFVNCADGKEMKQVTLVSCLVKSKQNAQLGNDVSNKPVPLDLADDWDQHKNVRAFSMLTDGNTDARRQSVNVAVSRRSEQSGSPTVLGAMMVGMAQAEFFGFNGAGHEDLWHMDWRARLVRFTFGDTSQTDTGDAAGQGVSGQSAGAISGLLDKFTNSSEAAALKDQFLLH